ncbi:MAG: PAS domain S-box protein, partial [Campylobacterota bacterium]
MSIRNKLFIQTTVILFLVLSLGAYAYLQSIQNIYQNSIKKDIKSDTQTMQNYLQNLRGYLDDTLYHLHNNEDILAHLNLISFYEDPQNYSLIFDTQKQKLIDKAQDALAASFMRLHLYDSDKKLISTQGYAFDGYKNSFVTYSNGQLHLQSNSQHKTIEQLPTLTHPLDTKCHFFIDKDYLILSKAAPLHSGDTVVGYAQVEYLLGSGSLDIVEGFLNHPLFITAKEDVYITPKNIDSQTVQNYNGSNDYEIISHPFDCLDSTFTLHHIIGKKFLNQEYEQLLIKMFFLALFIALISFAFSWYLSKKLILQPIYSLKRSINSIKKGEYKTITHINNDELGKVLLEFNSVFQKLWESYSFLDSYKKAVDSANIVSMTDLKGKITYVNDEFVRISGFSKEELLGSAHNIVRDPTMPKESFKQMWDTIQSGKLWRGIVKNRKKDGGYYWVDAAVNPIFDSEGNIKEYISIRRDITQQKEQSLQLQKLNETLQEEIATQVQEITKKDKLLQEQAKLAAMGEMISAIAHQWRQPLNALNINIQNLDDDFEEGLIDAAFIDSFIQRQT